VDVVTIANLALSHIGQRGTISSLDPPEGSEHAERAALFLPLARDTLLERHTWAWTMRRALGSPVAVTVEGWDHVYAVPTECVEVVAVLPDGYSDDYADTFGALEQPYNRRLPVMAGRYVPQPFVVESLEDGTPVVMTDTPDATLRYRVRVDDPTKWSALFVQAMTYQLAAMLAGAIVKGSEGATLARSSEQMVKMLLSQARVHDARQRNVRPQHQVGWIAAR
jgi:hypothetical protein